MKLMRMPPIVTSTTCCAGAVSSSTRADVGRTYEVIRVNPRVRSAAAYITKTDHGLSFAAAADQFSQVIQKIVQRVQ